jgi:hypothetical protein
MGAGLSAIENEDLAVLVEMLEHEHAKVARFRNVLTIFYVSCVVILLVTVCGLGLVMLNDNEDGMLGQHAFWIVSVLTTAGSIFVAAGGVYYNSHHCLRSIERALFCARRNRPKLVLNFVKQIECSAKRDRQVWVDLAMSLAS